jgi:hypothetical protein
MTEHAFKEKALDHVKNRRNLYARKNWGSVFSGSGVPDLFICAGRFVALELKHPDVAIRGVSIENDRYAEPAQRQQMAQIRASGGLAYVVNTLAQIDTILDAALNGNEP